MRLVAQVGPSQGLWMCTATGDITHTCTSTATPGERDVKCDQPKKNCGARSVTLRGAPLLLQAQNQAPGMDSEIRSQLAGGPQSRGTDKPLPLTMGYRSVKGNVTVIHF